MTTFVSRKSALHMLGEPSDSRLRNYELEDELAPLYDPEYDRYTDKDSDYERPVIVTDWCPFNGRFCAIADYVPHPHPPMNGEEPGADKNTAVPWRSWEPGMTERLRTR